MKEGWTYKTLGAVSFYPNERIRKENIQFNRYIGVENLVKNLGGINLSDELPDIDSAVKFEKGDILIGNIRPYLRKGWLSTFDGGASGDVIVVRIRKEYKEIIKDSFLYKILTSDKFFEFDNSHTKGAKMPRGDRNYISKFTIPIPPLAEQERIVAELDLLTEIIDKQKAQLKELDTLAQSIFYDMFGDPVENEKGWDVKKLGTVLKTTSGGTPAKGHPEYYEGGDILWINSGDLHQTYVYSVPKRITKEGLSKSSAKLFPIDTVLVAMYGATVGEVSILKVESATNQAVCGIFPDSSYNTIFLYSVLKHSKSHFIKLAAGGAQPNISQTIIKDFDLITPPIDSQKDFADKINAIEQQKAAITQSIADTQKLFDYTMDKYFG